MTDNRSTVSENNAKLLAKMMVMQNSLNEKMDTKWKRRGSDWYRAAWIEVGEMLGHLDGWKWWKSSKDQDPAKIMQAKIEVIDIIHFALSYYIEDANNFIDFNAKPLSGEYIGKMRAFMPTTLVYYDQCDPMPKKNIYETAEIFVKDLILCKGFELDGMTCLASIMSKLDMTMEWTFKYYMAKNALNNFRQVNGYKTGEYIKIWSGREDNEHLAEIVDGITDLDNFYDLAVEKLNDRYQIVLGSPAPSPI